MSVRVHLETVGPSAVAADLLTLPVAEGPRLGPAATAIDRLLAGVLGERVRAAGFKGKEGEVLVHPVPPGAIPSRCIALIGIGGAVPEPEPWRRYGAAARAEGGRQGARAVACSVGDVRREGAAVAVAEGFLLAGYRFDRYKSEADRRPGPERLLLLCERRVASVRRDIERVLVVTRETCRARDLVNEPAAVTTPAYLARVAAEVGREFGLHVEAWQGTKLKAAKLNGLLAVARGSAEPPRFIVLRYRPRGRSRKRVALVGKGITFDSGGLSLKTPKGMETMKHDMAGGAAVIATMAAVGALRPRIEVTGYVPATENLPGGRAQKPGDVIRYLNGKTVEVLNTDAEGRLILADALALASRARPDVIIDLATLTGACVVALGPQVAGIMGTDQRLVDRLIACGRMAGESLWQLPLVREYREDLKSTVADVKNVGSGSAGTITAALFLQEFVDGAAWAHLDIAGPAFAEKDLPYTPRGGTGFGVRTLVHYLTAL